MPRAHCWAHTAVCWLYYSRYIGPCNQPAPAAGLQQQDDELSTGQPWPTWPRQDSPTVGLWQATRAGSKAPCVCLPVCRMPPMGGTAAGGRQALSAAGAACSCCLLAQPSKSRCARTATQHAECAEPTCSSSSSLAAPFHVFLRTVTTAGPATRKQQQRRSAQLPVVLLPGPAHRAVPAVLQSSKEVQHK
jgi:hypothetical protein